MRLSLGMELANQKRAAFWADFPSLFRDGGKGYLLSSAAPAASWTTDAGDTLAGFGDPVGLALDIKDGVPASDGPGAHFSTAVTANRLTRGREPLGGVRNLLGYSQDFSNAAWVKFAQGTGVAPVVTANAGLAPDGTMTADRAQLSRAGAESADRSTLRQAVALPAASAGALSVWLKSNTGDSYDIVLINSSSLDATAVATVGADWARFDMEYSSSTTDSQILYIGLWGVSTADLTADVLVWGAQFEAGTATAYQNRTTINDVTEAGVPDVPFDRFDGVSDRLAGNATARDILKAAPGAEAHAAISWGGGFSAPLSIATDESFARFALAINSDGSVLLAVRRTDGDASTSVTTAAGAITQNTRVIIGGSVDYLNGGASAITVWINGVAVATGTLAGTGNTSDTASMNVRIGSDGGSGGFFSGQIFREIPIVARVLSAPERSAMIARLAALTGVTLS